MVECFEDGYLESVFRQVAGTCESAGTAADDGNFASGGVALALAFALGAVVVGYEAFQGADGYGFAFHAHHAASLALGFLRAHAATDGR